MGQGLARSRNGGRKGVSHLVYLIPILALAAIVGVYAFQALPVSSAPPAMDFTDQLVIQVESNNGSQLIPNIPPSRAVGEPGGLWATTQYNSWGVDAEHYPLYMDPPFINGQNAACQTSGACLFHVKSKVVHQYTLGDFFNVWGQAIGQNDTIGIPRNGNFAWEMCVGQTGNATPTTLYGNLVLQPGMDITLIFYDTVNGVGCA